MTTPKTRPPCTRCYKPVTWSDQRAQYGRALQYLTPDRAKAVSPIHRHCLTRLLREEGHKIYRRIR